MDKRQEEEVEHLVMDSLHKIFYDADENGNGEMEKDELLYMLRKPTVRDRLFMLQIPYFDLEMLFELFDTAEMDGAGTRGSINCDKFFRGVSKLRGPAKAADLHQMSIDLSRANVTCSDNCNIFSESNEVLARVLDAINETDIAIIQADVDAKDPLLVKRRTRGVKKISDGVRAPYLGPRIRPDTYNPWDQFPKVDGHSRKRPQSKEKVSPDHAVLDDKNLSPPERPSKGAPPKPPQPPQALWGGPDQPPPPPLPDHLLYLKASQDAQAQRQPKKGRMKGRRKQKEAFEFDDD